MNNVEPIEIDVRDENETSNDVRDDFFSNSENETSNLLELKTDLLDKEKEMEMVENSVSDVDDSVIERMIQRNQVGYLEKLHANPSGG